MAAFEILGHICGLGDLLGAGGMGRVFAVDHPRGPLALKLLHGALVEDPDMVGRLVGEAQAGRRVCHPNVVAVVDSGCALGIPYVVMERANGRPLGTIVQRDGALPLARIATIAAQLLDGLAAIHRARLVHADMKSDNVLVDEDDRVTIIDFGLARTPQSVTVRGDVRLVSGTPEYMAPEMIRSEPITAAADIYAVGVILYELVTGTTPFCGGSTTEIFERHLHDHVVPPSLRCPDRTIPRAFEAAILRALDKRAAARFSSADHMAAVIAQALPAGCAGDVPARRLTFSTTGPTCDWSRRTAAARPRRLAEGTGPHEPQESALVARRRHELAAANAECDADAIAMACIALTDALVADHRLRDAALELELVLGAFAARDITTDTMWCLLLSLAALYDGLGDHARARASAVAGADAAREVGSTVGRSRANALLRRLDAARTRCLGRPPHVQG